MKLFCFLSDFDESWSPLVLMRISIKKMNLGNHLFQDLDTYLVDVKSCRNKISRCKIGGKFKFFIYLTNWLSWEPSKLWSTAIHQNESLIKPDKNLASKPTKNGLRNPSLCKNIRKIYLAEVGIEPTAF